MKKTISTFATLSLLFLFSCKKEDTTKHTPEAPNEELHPAIEHYYETDGMLHIALRKGNYDDLNVIISISSTYTNANGSSNVLNYELDDEPNPYYINDTLIPEGFGNVAYNASENYLHYKFNTSYLALTNMVDSLHKQHVIIKNGEELYFTKEKEFKEKNGQLVIFVFEE